MDIKEEYKYFKGQGLLFQIPICIFTLKSQKYL